jgi:hypothetical protein
MRRILLCLPLCLVMGSDRPQFQQVAEKPPKVKDDGAPLPKAEDLARLVKDSPLTMFENCLKRYDREVKGYRAILQKQEFIDGKLYPTEVIEVCFREQPHSVYMAWKEGTRRAERVLYVKGENKDKMLCRPAGKAARFIAGDVVEREVDGSDARAAGRYTLNEFGMKIGLARTHADWSVAREERDLQTEYLGIKKLKEAGDLPCYAVRRTQKKPDRDGVAECTIYIDSKNWLPVGTVLKDEKGNLIGAYYWRDIELNPKFKKDQFEKSALTP